MELKSYLLAQLDREIALTRKAIERVPEGHNDFKPHERSMPLGYLSSLVAGMLAWIDLMIERDEYDIQGPDSRKFSPVVVSTRAELSASLDRSAAMARRALESTNEEHLLAPWTLKLAGNTVDQGPRHLMIADAVFSHLAHHRGQLTVYLRLNEAPVPSLYGPSADERY
ncbi:MAG TPA: DinB family protein [Terracidiphilus sp.]|jgi:uncharacterized damage-inducible protein DinB